MITDNGARIIMFQSYFAVWLQYVRTDFDSFQNFRICSRVTKMKMLIREKILAQQAVLDKAGSQMIVREYVQEFWSRTQQTPWM